VLAAIRRYNLLHIASPPSPKLCVVNLNKRFGCKAKGHDFVLQLSIIHTPTTDENPCTFFNNHTQEIVAFD
jgi:hypothetical protein